jgi:hypothetical protein
VELGAGERGNPCLQQLLKAAAHDLRDQVRAPVVVPSMSWFSSEAPLWVMVTVCVRLVVVLRTGSQTGPPWGPHEFSAFSAGFAGCPTLCHKKN